jgi:hypothetical protein
MASGGLAVVQGTASGLPVTEAASLKGIAVTKVASNGLPVVYVNEAGVVVPPVTAVTLDAASITAVTLSGGGLTATNTGTTSADQGARVATTSGKTSGKYYFEMTVDANELPNGGIGIGIRHDAHRQGDRLRSVWRFGNRHNMGEWEFRVGAVGPGQVGIAIDLDNRGLVSVAPAGNW